ncbi:hypothetical protein GCM10022277_07380 [Litoribacillus peritrichatus]|uniref:Efflux RND transporter periplasmic adaptor subunit n=1 Tax=Litoribacillus peritrichatus TaxID=718191 RepID=A0ABP7M9Q1_9GAMM
MINAIIPAYTSPYSRLYSSPIGYPALLRKLNRNIPVEVAPVVYGEMEKLISATGTVGYLQEVPIGIEVPGVVTAIQVSLGEKVTTGDVLVRLNAGGYDSRVAAFDVDIKLSQKLKTKHDYEREKKAFKEGLISAAELDQFEIAYKEAAIAYEKAKVSYEFAALSRSRKVGATDGKKSKSSRRGAPVKNADVIDVITPIYGTVIQKNIQVGQNLIQPLGRALTVGRNMVFQAQFSQRYLNSIQLGQKAELYLRAHPGRMFEVEVVRIDRVVKALPAGRGTKNYVPFVFDVWLSLDQEIEDAGEVVSGMNGYAVIRENKHRTLIPESAMMRYSGQQGTVLVVNPESMKIQTRRVELNVASNGWVGIEKGLTEGELVVKSGQIGLRENDTVELNGSYSMMPLLFRWLCQQLGKFQGCYE